MAFDSKYANILERIGPNGKKTFIIDLRPEFNGKFRLKISSHPSYHTSGSLNYYQKIMVEVSQIQKSGTGLIQILNIRAPSSYERLKKLILEKVKLNIVDEIMKL